jgi:hypothetical protein
MLYQQTVSDFIFLLKFRHRLGMIDGWVYADARANIIDHYMVARNNTEISR